MEEPEEQTHSFVLKFWLEEIDDATGEPVWRGHITHVASGKRQHLQGLEGVLDFIAEHLRITRKTRRQVVQWLSQLKQFLKRRN